MGLTTVANDARNARAKAMDAYNEMSTVTSKVSNIETQVIALKSLMGNIDAMKAELSKVSRGLGAEKPEGLTTADIQMLRARFKPAEVGETGELAKEKAEVLATEAQVTELHNKVEEVTAMVRLMKGMVESTSNKPVVEGWFERK